MAAPHPFLPLPPGTGPAAEEPPAIAAAKAALRRQMRALRAGLDPALGADLARLALAGWDFPQGAIIAGTWPLPGEIDTRPLLAALAARGCTIALPQTPDEPGPLLFRRHHPGEALQTGRFGTRVPAGDLLTPTLILVPLLAFDRAGGRLGQGGGFYDRTLAALPNALALGTAFAAQEVDKVPRSPHDRPLAAILTERGVIRPRA